ncbi:MAG: hypothetical protein ACTS8U_01760 [Arsenophonus sp. ET-DL9-MAG3]
MLFGPPTVPFCIARLRNYIDFVANYQLSDITELMEALNEFFNNHVDG